MRQGLSEAEAARRLAARGTVRPPATSRSYASIVRANVFTVFNLFLAAFGAVTLIFGDWRDALFLTILVVNTGIGITQEVGAKHALDRLALLVAPVATVVRDGRARPVPVAGVVVDDLVRVQAGDQIVADGAVEGADALWLDESILTGESRPVARRPGEEVRSGAFLAEGAGAYHVTAVGASSYAEGLAGEARSFRHPRSPLERAINRLLIGLIGLVLVLGGLLGYSLWHRDAPVHEAVATATAGVVSLVPEGLIVLASLTYAMGAVRMARRGVLAQQLNALESLASADVICMDKTGTLTEAALRVVRLVPAADAGEEELAHELARYAAAAPIRNLTIVALAEAKPAPPEPVRAQVPFSSRRRWSALQLGDDALVLGAPELFGFDGSMAAELDTETAAGRRVIALGRAPAGLPDAASEPAFPDRVRPLGLAVLAERLRPDARATVEFLRSEGVELKVLSGDAPSTVAAIAADAGIPVRAAADGRALPEDPEQLRRIALETTVVGRISPEGKRRIVEALRDAGRYVAMVGDGVNDVPALKAARLAIAQGTGAQMARSVADLVLVRGEFSAVPAMVAEGRKALRNLQRVAKLYVAKSAFASFLILTVGITATAYPLLPRHYTLVASVTVGIPTFFLALAPSSGPWRPTGFVREVSRFAVPAGFIAGVGVVASYLFALHDLDFSVLHARTIAASVLVIVGLYLILVLEASSRRRRNAVSALCAAMAALYAAALLLPPTREFFRLALPDPGMLATALSGAAISALALYLAGFTPGHPPDTGERAQEAEGG